MEKKYLKKASKETSQKVEYRIMYINVNRIEIAREDFKNHFLNDKLTNDIRFFGAAEGNHILNV